MKNSMVVHKSRQFGFYHVPRGDQTNVCVSVAFEALFVIAQVWKYMSIDDKSIKKLWDVCMCSMYTPMSII